MANATRLVVVVFALFAWQADEAGAGGLNVTKLDAPGSSAAPRWDRALPAYRSIRRQDIPLSAVTFFRDGSAAVRGSVQRASACPRGWFCIYKHADYRGRRLQFRTRGTQQRLFGRHRFNDKASSGKNRTNRRTVLWQDWCQGIGGCRDGNCFDAGERKPHFGDQNDEASAVDIATASRECVIGRNRY